MAKTGDGIKKIWNWLIHPRVWWFCIATVLFFSAVAGTALFLVFVDEGSKFYPLGYPLFFLSAIFLAYFIFCMIYFIPKLKKGVKSWSTKREFTNKLFTQYGFRTVVFAIISFVISLGNAAMNGIMGIVWSSIWFGALGIYYFLLSAMRGSVLLYHKKKKNFSEEALKRKEIKTYCLCGVWLILLPVALSAVIWEMVASNRAFVHAGLYIYVFAAYTFYKIIMSVYNYAKVRRTDDMTVRAIRNVNLADALVSVLALQTAMFHEFASSESLGTANAIMGAIVCALTAVIGIAMIINGILQIKKLDSENRSENE